jgi:DNA-binding MarR family transcriptional regulator
VVDALEDKGLVQRSPSPTDRRAIVLSLTEDGRGLLGRMRHHPGPDDDEVFAGLEPAELAQLTGLLRRVVSANRQEP